MSTRSGTLTSVWKKPIFFFKWWHLISLPWQACPNPSRWQEVHFNHFWVSPSPEGPLKPDHQGHTVVAGLFQVRPVALAPRGWLVPTSKPNQILAGSPSCKVPSGLLAPFSGIWDSILLWQSTEALMGFYTPSSASRNSLAPAPSRFTSSNCHQMLWCRGTGSCCDVVDFRGFTQQDESSPSESSDFLETRCPC